MISSKITSVNATVNRHLNLFEFFHGMYEPKYYEDNLSRAFALCLKHDTLFLDVILRQVFLPEQYETLFHIEHPNDLISIDIQKRPSNCGSFSTVVAVACTTALIDFTGIDKVVAKNTDNPECDVVLEIGDTIIIFEFKVTDEDCSAQLKCQAEKINNNEQRSETTIRYVDLNWQKIIRALQNTLSIQKQNGQQNQFVLDFLKFLEKRFARLFPINRLSLIPFYKSEDDPNYYQIQSRLNAIKGQIYGADKVEEISGKAYRLVLDVSDWRWANEVHVNSYTDINDGRPYLTIDIFPADTKAQGWHFYKKGRPAIQWPDNIEGFELEAAPYLKFSHFNSGLFWFCPNKDEYPITHTREFFENNAGRWYRGQWSDFESTLNSISKDWQTRCEYEAKLVNSKRSYFDLSIGVNLIVYIPYPEAQKMDTSIENSPLADKLRQVIDKIKILVDKTL